MADFSTSAELELEVSNRSLRDARSTVEQELGEIEVGVSASGDGRTRGQLAGILDANRQQYELAVKRNELLEEMQEDIEAGGGGGGGGLFAGGAAIRGGMALGGLLSGTTALAGAGALSLFGGMSLLFQGGSDEVGPTTGAERSETAREGVPLEYPDDWPPEINVEEFTKTIGVEDFTETIGVEPFVETIGVEPLEIERPGWLDVLIDGPNGDDTDATPTSDDRYGPGDNPPTFPPRNGNTGHPVITNPPEQNVEISVDQGDVNITAENNQDEIIERAKEENRKMVEDLENRMARNIRRHGI